MSRALPALLATLALAGCDLNEYLPTQAVGGSATGGGATFSFADPASDLLANADAASAPDLVRIDGRLGADTITIRLSFRGAIARFSAGQANSLDGILELDTDENGDTGIEPVVNRFGGTSTMGVDHYVLLSDVSASQMELVTVATSRRARVPATFGASDVTLRIPRALLGDVSRFRMAAVVGTPDAATDLAPNAGDLLVRPTR